MSRDEGTCEAGDGAERNSARRPRVAERTAARACSELGARASSSAGRRGRGPPTFLACLVEVSRLSRLLMTHHSASRVAGDLNLFLDLAFGQTGFSQILHLVKLDVVKKRPHLSAATTLSAPRLIAMFTEVFITPHHVFTARRKNRTVYSRGGRNKAQIPTMKRPRPPAAPPPHLMIARRGDQVGVR